MRNNLVALGVLALGILACTLPTLPTRTTPTPTPPRPTPSPSAVPTDAPRATEAADVQTAVVRQPVVQVHDGPSNEDAVSDWVEAGQEVVILGYDDSGDWVKIADPAGWVFVGCLEGLSEKGCIAE
jgi:hypothetical protein